MRRSWVQVPPSAPLLEMLNNKSRRIALTCSYIPTEIFEAFNLCAVRPTISQEDLYAAEGYLPRDFCPYARGIVGRIKRQKEEFAAVIFTTCCDALRRAADVLSFFNLHPNVFVIDLPFQNSYWAQSHYRKELEKLLKELSYTFSLKFSAPSLSLPLLARTDSLLSPLVLKNRKYNFEENYTEDLSSVIPLILSGTCLLDESLLSLVRQLNIEITFLDSCFGQRDRPKTITPNDDFLFSLSLSYLQKPPCPRMADKNRRFAWLQELIKEEKAQGMIYFAPKFCVHGNYELSWLQGNFPGFPLLFLEGEADCGFKAETRLRLEAFLEILKRRSKAN